MGKKDQAGSWRTSAAIAMIIAISIATYVVEGDAWVFGIGALMVFAYMLGLYFRRKPSITVWRIAYVTLFACTLGLAIFFAFSALLVNTGILPPSATTVGVLGGGGLIIGGAVGDWVGGRRGYRPVGSV